MSAKSLVPVLYARLVAHSEYCDRCDCELGDFCCDVDGQDWCEPCAEAVMADAMGDLAAILNHMNWRVPSHV